MGIQVVKPQAVTDTEGEQGEVCGGRSLAMKGAGFVYSRYLLGAEHCKLHRNISILQT